MSAANFSVRWVHRNPVFVTGFVPSSVEWLGTLIQIINDGRLLSNPLRSIEPKEIGLENSFDWLGRSADSILMEEFWNDILSPAAVAEEATLYSTRSAWLSQFALWPGPLTIADFRALMIAPWISENFGVRPIIIIPNAHLFVQEMIHRKRENRTVIRLSYLEPLVKANPDLSPVPFEELLDLPHTSEHFAAVYAILNHWYKKEKTANPDIILFPYQGLFQFPFQAVTQIIQEIGCRVKRDAGDALKAIRISYDGANYQKIPHSPKDPEGWKTSLHPGQIAAIDSVLERMDCPATGIADWSPKGAEPEVSSKITSGRSGSSRRSGLSSRSSRSSSSDSFGSSSSSSSSSSLPIDNRSSSGKSRSGRSSSGKSSRGERYSRRDNDNSDD